MTISPTHYFYSGPHVSVACQLLEKFNLFAKRDSKYTTKCRDFFFFKYRVLFIQEDFEDLLEGGLAGGAAHAAVGGGGDVEPLGGVAHGGAFHAEAFGG